VPARTREGFEHTNAFFGDFRTNAIARHDRQFKKNDSSHNRFSQPRILQKVIDLQRTDRRLNTMP
jgi:hypothetical protein